MPSYPGYRSANELDRLAQPRDDTNEILFLRVFRDSDDRLRAGLHPHPQATDTDHWTQGITLTDAADAINAATEHPENETLQRERLLVAAYHRLEHEPTTAGRVYVPSELRPWAVGFSLRGQPVVLYVQGGTKTGARYAAMETTRLLIQDEDDATFTQIA